jgi:hypothetical protein
VNKDILDITMYLIVAALIVLIIMNPKGFASAVTSTDTAANNTLKTISGSNYGK